VTDKCENTIAYPAILAGVTVQKSCLKEKEDNRSWFEKIFG